MNEIHPADVLARVNELSSRVEALYEVSVWIARLVIALITLTGLQLVAEAFITGRVLTIFRRVEALLTLNEAHGTLSDDKVSDLKRQTAAATRTVAAVVVAQAASVKNEIPGKVVQEIAKHAGPNAGESGVLPAVKLPPSPPPTTTPEPELPK